VHIKCEGEAPLNRANRKLTSHRPWAQRHMPTAPTYPQSTQHAWGLWHSNASELGMKTVSKTFASCALEADTVAQSRRCGLRGGPEWRALICTAATCTKEDRGGSYRKGGSVSSHEVLSMSWIVGECVITAAALPRWTLCTPSPSEGQTHFAQGAGGWWTLLPHVCRASFCVGTHCWCPQAP